MCEKDIAMEFTIFGDIIGIVHKKTYAFIEFSDHETACTAVEKM